MPLKELSLALGRNHSYLQQFVARGSPRTLPELVRHQLAALLEIPEQDLRDGGGDAMTPSSTGRDANPSTSLGPALSAPRVARTHTPETKGLAGEDPKRVLERCLETLSPHAVAMRLIEPAGILQPRHLVIFDPGEPIRMGDLVVVVDGSHVLGIGLLTAASREQIAWDEAGMAKQADRKIVKVWRVRAILAD